MLRPVEISAPFFRFRQFTLAGLNIQSGKAALIFLEDAARARTHGQSKTRAYRIWCAMIRRCENPNTIDYPKYGGRGIKVCDRWRHNFENFIADMGQPPQRHSINRLNNDGNYEPGNCEWASDNKQARNRSDTIFIEWMGQRHCIIEWSEITRLSESKIGSRYHRGLSPDRIFAGGKLP